MSAPAHSADALSLALSKLRTADPATFLVEVPSTAESLSDWRLKRAWDDWAEQIVEVAAGSEGIGAEWPFEPGLEAPDFADGLHHELARSHFRATDAARALADLDPLGRPFPRVVTELSSPDPALRRAAADAAGVQRLVDAAPRLVELCTDDSASVRAAAARALGEMGPDVASESVVTALVRSLDDASSRVRLAAAIALGRLGPATSAAIPSLESRLGDDPGGLVATALRRLRVQEVER